MTSERRRLLSKTQKIIVYKKADYITQAALHTNLDLLFGRALSNVEALKRLPSKFPAIVSNYAKRLLKG